MPHLPDIDIYEKLRSYIKRSGKTQRQLADEVGIPQPSYLSHMANGRVNWVEGEYFRPLSEALGLSIEEIRELKPEIIWEDRTPSSSSPLPPVVPHRPLPLNIPDELQKVIDDYGDTYPQLRDETMQRILTAPRNFGGPDNGPQTSEEWLEWFLLSRRYLR